MAKNGSRRPEAFPAGTTMSRSDDSSKGDYDEGSLGGRRLLETRAFPLKLQKPVFQQFIEMAGYSAWKNYGKGTGSLTRAGLPIPLDLKKGNGPLGG